MVKDRQTKLILIVISLMIVSLKAIKYSPTASEITLHGRYYIDQSAVKYDWTCFKIDFCFTNSTKVNWLVEDSWNIYHVIKDDNTTTKIHPKRSKNISIFESTQPESHCLEIVKITQNHYGPIASLKDSIFNGIEIDQGKLNKKDKKYAHRFQFLGDSLSTAFGVMSGRNPICFLKMKQIQNCLESWAVHLSNMFNADYRIQAVSGKGVVQNALGVPGPKMPALFTRSTDNSKQNSYKYQDKYTPTALFLLIGANDYNNIKNPSKASFIAAYEQMLMEITRQQMLYLGTGTKIINICDTEFNKDLCQNIKTAIRNFDEAYEQVYYVEIPVGTLPKENIGCIYHPNAKGQKNIATSIYDQVKDILQK